MLFKLALISGWSAGGCQISWAVISWSACHWMSIISQNFRTFLFLWRRSVCNTIASVTCQAQSAWNGKQGSKHGNRKSILVQSSMSCNVYIVNHGTLSNPCLASWFQTPLVLWIKQLHMRLWVLAQCVPELCEEFFGRKSHKAAKSSRPFPNRQLPHGAASQHWTAQEFEGWRAANICCTCVRLQAFKNTLNEQQEWCGRIAFLPSSCLTSIRVHMQDPVKT